MTLPDRETGWIGSWSPGIGDPTVVGWFTAFAYLGTAFLCFQVYRRLRAARTDDAPGGLATLVPFLWAVTAQRGRLTRVGDAARMRALWLGLAITLFFLGINKQLDLQTAFTEIGRMAAQSGGWYERRHRVQKVFIAGVVGAGLWGVLALWTLVRGQVRRVWPALVGTLFLACFVAVRASSFHHVDILLGTYVGGVKVNWALELGGIACVAGGAARALRAARPLAPVELPGPLSETRPQ